MVQQQYIIAELSDHDLMAGGSIINKGIHISENKQAAKDNLMAQKEFSEKIVDNTRKKPIMNKAGSIIPVDQISQKLVGVTRPSLGIFGSLSSSIIIRNPDIAENLNLQA